MAVDIQHTIVMVPCLSSRRHYSWLP